MKYARFGAGLVLALVTPLLSVSAQNGQPLSAFPSGGFQFSGMWDCAGTLYGRVHQSTFTGQPILGGKWLELTEEDIHPASHYLGKYLIGYDSEHKRLVEFDASNFGADIYFNSVGWANGTLIMTSPVSPDAKAPYAANRFVYSLVGTDSFSVDWQVSKTSVMEWQTKDHLTCKRRGQAEAAGRRG
jgi:hypothetical protein